MYKASPQSTHSKGKGLIPDYLFKDVTDISSDYLEKLGIKLLMMDLDNTIAAYDEHTLSADIIDWISTIKNSGIDLYIISNSTREKRVSSLSGEIDVDFIMRANKPSNKSLLKAMKLTGHSAETSALVGDQIFTDGIAANRAGITSMLVCPRRFTNPFLAIRYFIELPFRAFCNNKNGGY